MPGRPPHDTNDDRRTATFNGPAALSGVPIRHADLEPTRGLFWVAKLFRVMSVMLLVLVAVQLFLGLTSTVEISYGLLFAEVIRLMVFAGLLWGGGDLVDLMVKSHYDLRATRILLDRLTRPPGHEHEPSGRGDATH